MLKYREKPVVVEAIQYMMGQAVPDSWIPSFRNVIRFDGPDLIIRTNEGEKRTTPGDWIIRGVNGEFYPCKPDIFLSTYECAD